MNINLLRKAIHSAYLDYYGDQISSECVKRMINYYKQSTKEHRIECEKLRSKHDTQRSS